MGNPHIFGQIQSFGFFHNKKVRRVSELAWRVTNEPQTQNPHFKANKVIMGESTWLAQDFLDNFLSKAQKVQQTSTSKEPLKHANKKQTVFMQASMAFCP